MRHLGMKTALVLAVMATGCVTDERVEVQLCPEGSLKTEPGVCGCDVEDVDGDGDTIMDCVDLCPEDANKSAPGTCGCGVPDTDTDGDTVPDCFDLCPEDQNKKDPGACGCGVPDADTDGDTVPDCFDLCPEDPNKKAPGTCGCGMPDIDTDGDTVPDCLDKCPEDPNKTSTGLCGCGVVDTPEGILDSDGDGVIDCLDGCPNNPYKTAPGSSTCEDRDTDGDGVEDALDDCPYNPTIQKLAEGGSCNFKTETIENGETIDVFEVWSAYDLVELRKYLETSPLGMDYSRCEEEEKLICGPEPDTAYLCAGGLSRKTMCYGGCSVDGEATVCKRCNETTENHEIGECCTSTDSIFVCTSDKKYKTCEKIDGVEQIVELECDNGYACSEGGGKASCKAMEVAEGALTTGGNAGDECNSSQYKSTCTSETQMLVCLDGKVAIETVEYCKEDASTGWSIALPLIAPTYKLRVKLMQDIELADALPIVEKESAQCAADWTPMNINHVDFDGQGHTIYLSKRRSECMLNDSLFTIVSKSRVSNLNLSYNIGGQSVSVLSIDIVDSIIEHLSYRGERRSTYPLFSESRIINGNPIPTSTLSDSIESSRVEDVKFDIPVLHSSEFSHKVTNSLLKDIAIRVGKQYCDSSISIDGKCHIISRLHQSSLVNVSYDIDRLDFTSSSTGIIKRWSMLPTVDDALFENLSLKISSIDVSHVQTIDQFNIVSFSSVMNVDGMHIELGDIVDEKTKPSNSHIINTFNGINVVNSPSRVLNDVTFNAGRIQANDISLLNQSNAKLTKSTFKTGDIDSDVFVLFNFEKPEEKTEVEGLSVEIGNIKSESKTTLFDGNNYTIDQLNVKAGVIETPVYVMMGENTKTTLKHADLSFDEIHSIDRAELMSYMGPRGFTGEDISISAKKVTSEKIVGFNDKMIDSKIQGLRIDIGEINAGSFAGLGLIQGSALTNIAVRVDRVVTKDSLYLISEFTDSEMTNGSFYGNLYGKADKTFPFVRVWGKEKGTPKMENVVSSMSAYTYTANAETGAMENIKPVVNSVFLNEFTKPTTEPPDDTIKPVATNVYWLKRVAAAKPFSSNDYAGFTPYYIDKTIDANGKTAQDVVTALGANWEILSATEDGATIEIPWLKKPAAATNEP